MAANVVVLLCAICWILGGIVAVRIDGVDRDKGPLSIRLED